MAANDRIRLQDAAITETAQSVAASLAQAAQPGPVPVATGASPIDGAAATVASAVVAHVVASAADLAPRSAEGLAKSQAALAEMKAQDNANAAAITMVPAELVSYSGGEDDWFYGEDGIDRLPGPAGAGPGLSVIPGTGVPEELI
jgi:hypothetical protein